MSTDQQRISIPMQQQLIEKYAADHGLAIIKTYRDEGQSGLSIDGRKQLCKLLEDVISRRADYRTILVYDVSRWGRFQDTDEAGYYEFICRSNGINVVYCAEPFPSDGSPMNAVLKNIKRVMAGEYSRELSDKVYRAKCKVVEMGFMPGSIAPYGMRRMLVDPSGKPAGVLEYGQHKFRQADRVTLTSGPPDEIRVVRWMFQAVVCKGWGFARITKRLNERGVPSARGRRWTTSAVQSVLKNEKYIGNLVYGMTSAKLRSSAKRIPEEAWQRKVGVFEPIISRSLFERAQRTMASWPTRVTNEDGLVRLKRLFQKSGYLTYDLIARTKGMPRPDWYAHRFGSLLRAYQLVGYKPKKSYDYYQGLTQRLRLLDQARQDIIGRLRALGARVDPINRVTFTLNGGPKVGVRMAYCKQTPAGPRWLVQTEVRPKPLWMFIIRLDEKGAVADYWLVSGRKNIQLCHPLRRPRIEYRADSIDPLLTILLEQSPSTPPPLATVKAMERARLFRTAKTPNLVSLAEAIIPLLRGKVLRAREIAAELVARRYSTASERFERMVRTTASGNPQLFRRVGGCWYTLTDAGIAMDADIPAALG